MKFVLTGFSQDETVRRYSFQGIAPGGKRTDLNVGVDLALVHKHGIPLQEIPLLCTQFLATLGGVDQNRKFELSEGDMRARSEQRAMERMESQSKNKPAAAPPIEMPRSEAVPLTMPPHGSRNVGIGLGSRTAYPWSPHIQATTKR
jgi:hypothetical protein